MIIVKYLKKKIYSLNSNEFEIFEKVKSFNEQINELKKIKINLYNLKQLNILESEINNYFNLLELLFGIQLELLELTKEIKKSEISLNNSNEYDIEYFNLKHEKWKIITIFLILNFLLIYLFIYRKLENLIKLIR